VIRSSRLSLVLALAAWALTAPAAVSAQNQEAPPEVTYRQNLMRLLGTNMGQLRAVGGLGHSSHTVHYARALYGVGEILGAAFENGSPEGSGSLPAVWQNRRGFNERVDAFAAAAGRLLEAAERRDAAAIQQATQEVGQTCGACHQSFRERRND